MTKKEKILSNQMSLFEYVKRAQELTQTASKLPPRGSLDIDSEFRFAVSADIKECPLSRYQVAARMSELVGQEVTAAMLNNWSAESHENHRFPCQFLPAFVMVTGGRAAFDCLSRRAGLFALPGPEVLRAEIQRIDEEIRAKKEEKTKRMIYLKEMEK